jgi:hypothetical protein
MSPWRTPFFNRRIIAIPKVTLSGGKENIAFAFSSRIRPSDLAWTCAKCAADLWLWEMRNVPNSKKNRREAASGAEHQEADAVALQTMLKLPARSLAKSNKKYCGKSFLYDSRAESPMSPRGGLHRIWRPFLVIFLRAWKEGFLSGATLKGMEISCAGGCLPHIVQPDLP